MTGTLYAVAESECPANTQCNSNNFPIFFHRLYALDISSLVETNGGHVQICSSGCGNGKYLTGSDFSISHYSRPGLLFLDSTKSGSSNMVYAAFSMIDAGQNDPNGFIWAYDGHHLVTTAPLVYETTPGANKRRGGIWQGGAGLMAAQDSGRSSYYLYFSTGDGDFDLDQMQSPNTDAADSFVKLNTDLTIPSGTYYFTPADQFWRGCPPPNFNDFDFGSGGTLAIPESVFNGQSFYAVKADKENYLWVMDRTNPGGYTGGQTGTNCGSQQNCNYRCMNANNNVEPPIAFRTNHTSEPEARSTPAFWSGSVSNSGDVGELYFATPGIGASGQMQRYAVNTSCNPRPICQPAATTTNIDPTGSGLGYASTPSVSSNSSYQNGIVWTIKQDTNETAPVLFALDAGTLGELWDSQQCQTPNGSYRDQPGTATKFSVPTIANGYVYIGTETDFDIYGLVTSRTCSPSFR
jgi:hypothetical protein